MKWKITNMKTCLKLMSAIVLLAGLGSAILIYLTAEKDSERALGYEVVGGGVYSSAPENSKMYEHDLELYGGKAAVLTNEFRYWFVGLWHGKSLAITVAIIAIFISFVIYFIGTHLPSDVIPSDENENNHRGKYFNP
jgi:hypothetical protein